MRVFRFEVVETLLIVGIPISEIGVLHSLFEKYAHSQERVKAELQEVKAVSVTFDGTARLGEALAVVAGVVQEDFKPTKRLVYLEMLAKPMKGVELAQRLMSNIAVKHNLGSDMVFAAMRDGASLNGAAIRQLLFFYPNILDVMVYVSLIKLMSDPILTLSFWTYFFHTG